MESLKRNLHIASIIASYLKSDITIAQQEELDHWLKAETSNQQLFDRIVDNKQLAASLHEWLASDTDTAWQQMKVRMEEEQTKPNVDNRPQKHWRLPTPRWIAVAAMLLIALTIGIYWMAGRFDAALSTIGNPSHMANDIAPGGNKATLTLADGRSIALSTEQTGIVIGDSLAYADGSRVVEGSLASTETSLQLTTPRGGQYQVVLPDGTQVWLNAASTLTYDGAADKSKRMVKLEGEAYFDVAKRPNQPFIVQSKNQTIQVLGTQFNVSAYANEADSRTTLIEGSVQLSSTSGARIMLKPNEQAVVKGNRMQAYTVDVNPYIAWKEGLMIFNREDIASVIRRIERWYDVDFDPVQWPSELQLEGQIPRNTSLSGILDVLEINTGKTFSIKGRRVMVHD